MRLVFFILLLLIPSKVLAKESGTTRFYQFKEQQLDKVTIFSEQYLKPLYKYRSVFYPFGGPDLFYPVTLFPNAENYTIVGLEPIRVPGNYSASSTNNLIFKDILRSGFFVTKNMQRTIRKEGVLPVFLHEIRLLGGVILDVNVESSNLLTITFKLNSTVKTLRYLSVNLANYSLKPRTIAYLTDNKLVEVVMIKSCSYTLHFKDFSIIRQFILDNANAIIQDDSGVPIKYIGTDLFNIDTYGNYRKPFGKDWTPLQQPLLAKMYSEQSNKVKLDFCYGYGCKRAETPLIVILRLLEK